MTLREEYCIQNTKYPDMYWDNDWGWIDTGEEAFAEATFSIFTKSEKAQLNLPVEGKWIVYGE